MITIEQRIASVGDALASLEDEAAKESRAGEGDEALLNERLVEARALLASMGRASIYARLFLVFIGGVLLYLMFVWIPSIAFRSRIAAAVGHCMVRLASVADVEDYSRLCRAEGQVRDMESAHEFMDQLCGMAERFGFGAIPQAISPWVHTQAK